MEIDLSGQKLPEIFTRNGKRCYLDPIRERLTYVTPEETVRQRMISYIMDRLDVPANMIRVEEPLRRYGIN